MTASYTAYTIALTLRNLGHDSPFIRAFVAHGDDSAMKKLSRSLPPQLHLRLMERLFVPGMAMHYLGRKRLIREQVEKHLAMGMPQIVQIGAGFDELACVLSESHPNVTFIEMDLPATQQVKRHALSLAGIKTPPNLHFIPVDLSITSLPQALQLIHAFDASKPTLFLFEGVLMYVPETAVLETFKAIASLHSGNMVLFGAMAKPDSEGHLVQRIIASFLDFFGEKIRWVCPAGNMPAFLLSAGLQLQQQWEYAKIQEISGVLCDIEDEHYYLARTQNG